MHAGLDGSSDTQILDQGPRNIAAARGRLYFTTATEVDSVSATGGPVTTVAANQNAPALLTVAGGNLVWGTGLELDRDAGISLVGVDSGSSGPVQPPGRLVTACLLE
jgi:hypothetical protein